MPSTRLIVHGSFAAIAFSAAAGSILVALNLGGFKFLSQNFFNGLCVDVWDGFFLSPLNLIAIGFLMFLPFHCYLVHTPHSILCLVSIMAFPSFLFFTAAFLETSPVLLPLGLTIGCFVKFGWSEFENATRISSKCSSSRSSSTSKLRINSSNSDSPTDEIKPMKPVSLIKRKRTNS